MFENGAKTRRTRKIGNSSYAKDDNDNDGDDDNDDNDDGDIENLEL